MKKADLNEFLRNVSKIRKFRVDESCLKNVLRIIQERQPLDLWDIFKYSDEYFDAIIVITTKMVEDGLLHVDSHGKFHLTEKGFQLVNEIGIKLLPNEFKPRVTFSLPPTMRSTLKIMRKIYAKIKPKTEYEQGPLSPKSALQKIAFVTERGDVLGKEIICIGDDDLLSIVLGLTELPKSITVVDIDDGILNLIDKYRKKLGIKVPIEVHKHNLVNPIPKELKNRFDVFLTQPPDTVLGFTLFVSRGVESLKPKPGMIGYAGLTTIGCPRLGLLRIQEIFTEMGLLITDDLSKFLKYLPGETEIKKVEVPEYVPFPAKKIWYVSDLIRIKTTKKTKPFYKGKVKENVADYTADAQKYQ